VNDCAHASTMDDRGLPFSALHGIVQRERVRDRPSKRWMTPFGDVCRDKALKNMEAQESDYRRPA